MGISFIPVPPNRNMVKTIKLSDETHKKLGKLGTKDETYEEIIIKLIGKK